jgi:actinorhodin biosynthesis protein ActVIA
MSTRTSLGAVLLTAVLAAAASGQVKSPAKPAALTAMDYIEIRQLVNRYAFALDTGSNNGFDYADLFAADGEFIRPYAKGREQLAALARGERLGPLNTVHYIMNHVIEPTADGAIGKEYLVELNWDIAPAAGGSGRGATNGPANGWDIVGRKAGELARTGGHYEDVYVKTPVGWRFKRRDFIPSKSGADPAPLPPPRIPENSAPIDMRKPLAPAANYVAPTQQSSLTASDYLEIAQLVASYGHALDSGYGKGENGEAYANLYTPDAAFAGAEGHMQLVRLAQIQPRGPDFVRHYLTNHVVEPMPGGAKGKEYLAVIDNGENGKPSSLFLGGHYEDTYVKTPEGWRIKTRRLFPPRSGPQPPNTPAPAAVAAAGAPAATVGRAAGPLSASDYVEIQQLIARSAYALDTAADRGAAYAQLFAPEGVFASKTARPFEIKGRAQLASFAMGDLTHRGPTYVREYLTNYIVQPSNSGATSRVYVVWMEIGENGSPGVIQSGGHYEDEYVRTRDGWRIGRRTFVPSKLGDRDVYDVARTQRPAARTDNVGPKPTELTAIDYFQIQQLVAKYAQYIDTCSNNGYDYADLFAEDGFFAPFQNGQIGRKAQGREALARVSGGGPDGCTGAGWIRQGVHHIYVNHIIDPTPEGAKGQVNMLMIGLGGDKNKIEHDGYYEDTYVKTPTGWKFKSRIHHATYTPPRDAQK